MKRNLKIIAVLIIFCLLDGCAGATSKVQTGRTTVMDTPIVENFKQGGMEYVYTPYSTAFSKIGYNSTDNTLLVTFRDSEVSYLYLDFPASEWKIFKSSDSLGKYYNSKIKGNYDCERIEK